MIQAILLAGGKGTRLAPLTDHLPKPLVTIHGKPMMQYVLEHLRAAGITNVAVSVAHLGHLIEQEFGDGSELGMTLTYLREPEPMGTGGWAMLANWDALDDHFFVVNADNLFWIDLQAFMQRHRATNAIATIAGTELPSSDIVNYEILRTDEERERLLGYIDRTQSAKELEGRASGHINTGWYIMTKDVRQFVDTTLPFSNEVHLLPRIAASGHPVGFYHATEPWFDSGTHERLVRVASFIEKHILAPQS